METNRKFRIRSVRNASCHGQRTTDDGRRAAFTLVELLVVITIIGILVALVTVAAVGALRKSRETEIKTEVNQIDAGFEEYKNKATAYPPNCQVDDTSLAAEAPTSSTPIDEGAVFNNLKRHLKQAFPRHQESDNLIRALIGLPAVGNDASQYPRALPGGMTAGEAVVFWLGGFSSDPKYPISGEGGPSYEIGSIGGSINRTLDPIEGRTWTYPMAIERLGPRADDNYFDDSQGRFIEYQVSINGQPRVLRINFWQYTPRNSEQPYLYFDTSRGAPTPGTDPPAATALTGLGPDGQGLHVHSFKRAGDTPNSVDYVNPDKFQIIHCGLDGDWGEEAFERMSMHHIVSNPNDYLLYPDGPFVGEIADTIVNFGTGTKIEDAQP